MSKIKIINTLQDGYSYKDIKKLISSNNAKRASCSDEVYKQALSIVNDVKDRGDKALIEQISKFDKWQPKSTSNGKIGIKVDKKEFKDAYDRLAKKDKDIIKAIKFAKKQISKYHKKQIQNSWFDTSENGTILGAKITPMSKAGLYIPGGKAFYPSTLLMNAIPAKIAGVKKIIVCTPAINGELSDTLLACCYICNIDNVYKVGGAGAISAMAYGTKTIPKVDVITGPGNIYVALAKSIVFGEVNIDMIAGPSEIGIIADESANYKYVAMDLLSQAEHDEMASSVLITTCAKLALDVQKQIDSNLQTLSRKEIATKAIVNNSYIIVAKNIKQAIKIANFIAFEHLEIMTSKQIKGSLDAWEVLPHIKNAGAIFLGEHTPEAIGDYIAGPNHTLPTNSSAKFSSPLSVDTFVKKSSVICYSKNALTKNGKYCTKFASSEGLDAHRLSVQIRLDDINKQ